MISFLAATLVLIITSFILLRINWISNNPSSSSIFKKNINEPQFTKEQIHANNLITCGILQLCFAITSGTFFYLIFKVEAINSFVKSLWSFDLVNFLMMFNLALWLAGFVLTIIGLTLRFRLENNFNKDIKFSLMKLSFGSFYKK